MRVVPHPVTLITASLTSPLTSSRHTPPEHTFRGATVSSFNSVALHPVPLISLNMKLPSSTYDAMATSGTFLAHILAANTAGARIAGSFAKPGGAIDAFAGLALGVDGRKAECTVLTGPATGGAPMLGGTEGVLKVLRCRLCQGKEVRVGDHVVLIAEVVGVLSGSSEGGNGSGFNYMKAGKGSQEALHGLVYMDGAYRRVEIGGDLMEAGDVVEEETLKNREPVIRTMGMNIRRGDEHETERRS
jgi:flavin reductase (DIM6/NTAB) family NADH-FMN oxidoreductase RutF